MLAPGSRIVIADMVTDRLVMRVLDLVLRRVQASHVGCRRSAELERLLTNAGFTAPSVQPLFHGFYAIVAARLPGST